MPRSAATLCTWLALLASGCAAARPPAPASAYRPDRPAEVRTVRGGGEYLLIRAGNRTEGDRVVTRRALVAGDAVGFTRDGVGVLAVAGGNCFPLVEGAYHWQEITPTGESRAGRLADVGRRWDAPLAAAGRLYLDALQPFLGVAAVVGLVAMLGVIVYGLCNRKAVGIDLRH